MISLKGGTQTVAPLYLSRMSSFNSSHFILEFRLEKVTSIMLSDLNQIQRARDRHTSYSCASLYCTSQIRHSSQTEGLWQPCMKPVCWRHFPNSFMWLYVSVSQFGNTRNISNFFPIIGYGDLWSEIFDVTIVPVVECHKSCPRKTTNSVDKCMFWLLH